MRSWSLQLFGAITVALTFILLIYSGVHVSHKKLSYAVNSIPLMDTVKVRTGHSLVVLNEDRQLHNDDDKVAKELSQKIRILVWVMTQPDNLETKAKAVKETWGKRCNKLVFFSSETNTKFPTIGLNVSEGREHLTAKTMRGFKYVYDHFFDEADWFMKADDDTYVILENLRYFLSEQNTSEPIFFGQHFYYEILKVNQGYYSGGGGYVLSKEALRRFGQNANDPRICYQDGGAEDVELGRCLETLGVRTASSTDSMGRSRFHCFDVGTHVVGDFPNWYYSFDVNGGKKGIENISDYAISFHYVHFKEMLALEFYIYHLRTYGIVYGLQQLNKH